jgi:hypothetical protein
MDDHNIMAITDVGFKAELKFILQVLNIFIIIKITKSARFRKQFRRHDDEDEQDEQDTDQEDLIQQRNKSCNISGKILKNRFENLSEPTALTWMHKLSR